MIRAGGCGGGFARMRLSNCACAAMGILAAALGDVGAVDDQIYQHANEWQHDDEHDLGGLGPA